MYNTTLFLSIICIIFSVNPEVNAQDHENVEQVGRIYNQWDHAEDVVVVGDLVYVATGVSGLQILDVSNPEHPREVGNYDTPGEAWGVTVSGDYAYVADYRSGLRVISVADPEHPEEVGYCDTQGSALGVTVYGNYAYVADGIGLCVISVADPEHPQEVGYCDTPGSARNVAVSDDYAYVADAPIWNGNGEEFVGGGLRVISILDPEHPEEVGYCDTPDYAYGVTVSGDYAYVADLWEGLCIISVADPENPEEVGHYDTYGLAFGVTVSGDYAYVTSEGLVVVSIADPEHPEGVGYCYTPWFFATQVAVSGDYAYVVTGGNGLRIISVADLENPEEVGYYDTGYALGVTVSGDYAYVADDDSGLRIISVSDPDHPEEVGYFDTPQSAQGVTVSGNYAYLASNPEWNDEEYVGGGLRIISVADPEHPEEVGRCYTEGINYGVAVSGDYAYIANNLRWFNEENFNVGLHVISINDPENPEEVGYCDVLDNAWGVTVSGNYAYLASNPEWNGEEYVGGGLHVISVLDPEHPEEVGYCDTPGWSYDVKVSGDFAYVADGYNGLRVISVADPEHPQEVGYCDTPGYALGVTVSGGYAYIADWESGLRVISVADPENPQEVGYYDTPGEARDVALSEDGLIYVADGTNVGIYRFTDPAKVDDSFIPHPSSLILYPAHPNPFNSTTTIRYSLPNPTHVSLDVYNLTGQQISTLFDGYLQVGFHSTNLTANNLPSGLYFVKLEASGEVVTQKVMLMR